MNSAASQSNNSGCEGIAPWVPKSFSVSTRPTPKYCCQTRFIVTRAVSGFFGSTSQREKSNRLLTTLPPLLRGGDCERFDNTPPAPPSKGGEMVAAPLSEGGERRDTHAGTPGPT